ncbi:MAG: hypothetical protein K9N09_01105 [Candidatus Cloacimonetes bacterium]|nr:hypothetical protein [Candidatus Cloacimonadota bacterium]MCF7812996.1 hypothetical protein [Candidatus Cloacimonadota bacterium]MCF7867272.1 hypothetical protein [Candidatus Cloacimonadota bacterium]MCF7882716.1 hypothetical protein [Candidatus Cloacimonadota bacterium]
MEKHERLNITLPAGIALELSKLAEEMNNKKSRIIADALELYFDEMDAELAEKRMIENGEELVPAEKIWKELSL